MTDSRELEERRRFLLKSVSIVMGCLFGPGLVSRAFGMQDMPPVPRPRISLIIDDIGYSCCRARLLLDLKVPITFSVLPKLPNSHKLAREIHEEGQEVMLHQPMEPYNPHIDPGPGAIFVEDPADRITRTMEENLSDIPFAVGVNNHMGSKFTSCAGKMDQALRVVKERALFFVDSLTTSRSTAYKTAKDLHVPAACRNIFLDHQPEESAVLHQLGRLMTLARTHGEAIGIGHPHRETIRAVTCAVPHLLKAGISFVPISDLIPTA